VVGPINILIYQVNVRELEIYNMTGILIFLNAFKDLA
jgi:hypothetical protein